jgi:hypothetical protein
MITNPVKTLKVFEIEWRSRAYLMAINARDLSKQALQNAKNVASLELAGALRQRVIDDLDDLLKINKSKSKRGRDDG